MVTMNAGKPISPSADRNKQAILEALQCEVNTGDLVFEFGSGTGQHICHFGARLPQVRWQPSDLADKLPGMRQWIGESDCTNILTPVELDLNSGQLPEMKASVCYSANTLHIVSWLLVEKIFKSAAMMMLEGGKLCIYGPFIFEGKHVSDGNRVFDQQLRSADPLSGIRDVNDLNLIAQQNTFLPARIIPMPANNHLLIWDRCLG